MNPWQEVQGSTSHVNCLVGKKCELCITCGLPSLVYSESVEEIFVQHSVLACTKRLLVLCAGRLRSYIWLTVKDELSIFFLCLLSLFLSSKIELLTKATLVPVIRRRVVLLSFPQDVSLTIASTWSTAGEYKVKVRPCELELQYPLSLAQLCLWNTIRLSDCNRHWVVCHWLCGGLSRDKIVSSEVGNCFWLRSR